MREELLRQVAASPATGQAHSQLANIEGLNRNWPAAIEQLEAARRIDPALPRLDERERLAREALAHEPRRR